MKWTTDLNFDCCNMCSWHEIIMNGTRRYINHFDTRKDRNIEPRTSQTHADPCSFSVLTQVQSSWCLLEGLTSKPLQTKIPFYKSLKGNSFFRAYLANNWIVNSPLLWVSFKPLTPEYTQGWCKPKCTTHTNVPRPLLKGQIKQFLRGLCLLIPSRT